MSGQSTVTTGVPTLVRGRAGVWMPFIVGAVLVVMMAILPLLNIEIPGVLPGATYTPGIFLETLEKHAVAADVGRWVMNEACAQLVRARRSGISLGSISVTEFG